MKPRSSMQRPAPGTGNIKSSHRQSGDLFLSPLSARRLGNKDRFWRQTHAQVFSTSLM